MQGKKKYRPDVASRVPTLEQERSKPDVEHVGVKLSKAVGVRLWVSKKTQEAQKAKALSAMKAAKDRREEFYDPARKDNILGRNQTRLELWEEHVKDPIVALDKALKCVESQY